MSDERKPMFRYVKVTVQPNVVSAHLGKHVPAGTMIVRDSSGRVERADADLTEAQQQVAEYKRAIEASHLELRRELDALDVQRREVIALYERHIAKLQGKIAELEKGEADE